MVDGSLTELERELLELASLGTAGGVTTTSLDAEMLEVSPGRSTVEATLRGLAARGLIKSERELFVGMERARDGVHPREQAHLRKAVHREYIDDWWIVTNPGRALIGCPVLPPRVPSARPSAPIRVLRWFILRIARVQSRRM